MIAALRLDVLSLIPLTPMSFERYLNNNSLIEIRDAALAENLYLARREFLLADLSLDFIGGIPMKFTAPKDLILADLQYLNAIEYLDGNVVPLAVWLGNAASHAVMPPKREVFRKGQTEVLAAFSFNRPATEPPNETVAGSREERIVHQNDMVPYSFLAAGHAAGTSVARLLVPRFEGGSPRLHPGGTSVRYFGTGWLLGQRYLVTNHHVVNARDDAEPDATEADLALQAKGAQVQFDYNSDGAEGRVVLVEQLEAWHRRGQLDYAVLKLATDAGPALRLAGQMPTASSSQTVAVNIVQHPGGAPKQLGIRNNVLYRVTERDIEYFTDTDGGSSGSPVLDDGWKVVGLHKLSKPVSNVMFQGMPSPFVNVATRIDLVVNDLKTRFPDLWKAIDASG